MNFRNKLEFLSLASPSSLVFCLRARPGAYPRVDHLKGSSIVGSCFTNKHYTRVERLARRKRSSLIQKIATYGHKTFYNIGPRSWLRRPSLRRKLFRCKTLTEHRTILWINSDIISVVGNSTHDLMFEGSKPFNAWLYTRTITRLCIENSCSTLCRSLKSWSYVWGFKSIHCLIIHKN
jgi:hypothetical protein